MPWLFNEDYALKIKLQHMTVTDANNPQGKEVKVRYRLPEVEVSNLDFPIVIISHNGWPIANDREHRGFIQLPYAPEGFATWWDDSGGPSKAEFSPADSPYYSYFPIPYNLDYRVDVLSRFMTDHAMPLIVQLAQYERLHPKFGFLDVPQDGTKRTMQLLGGPEMTTLKDENDKRLFQTTYLVRVFSEMIPEVVEPALANLINLDLSVYTDTTNLTGTEPFSESRGILSVGGSTSWNIQ